MRGKQRRFSQPSTVISVIFLTLVVGVLVVVPFLPWYAPTDNDLSSTNLGFMERSSSGSLHLFGTDQLGRDSLSQLVLGGRSSLFIAIASVGLSVVIGPILGVLAAYFRGPLDRIIVSLSDLLLAIPRVLLIIAVVAILGRSVPLLIFMLGITGWVIYARVVRSVALSVKNEDYVAAAVGMGAGSLRILGQHILPNTVSQVVVLASLDIGKLVLIESSLSYLGLGVQEPNTSWGLMVARAEPLMQANPRLLLLPAVTLSLVILALNFAARAMTSETRETEQGVRMQAGV